MARLLVLAVVGLAAAPLPALAGSATSQSIWNMGHALGQAKSQVPNGATVTGFLLIGFGILPFLHREAKDKPRQTPSV